MKPIRLSTAIIAVVGGRLGHSDSCLSNQYFSSDGGTTNCLSSYFLCRNPIVRVHAEKFAIRYVLAYLKDAQSEWFR